MLHLYFITVFHKPEIANLYDFLIISYKNILRFYVSVHHANFY